MATNTASDGSKFPVIGLGASAGGLEALKTFFAALPPNTGMAFVVIQHLMPDHESILPELIQRHTSLRVQVITDDAEVLPDQVYILPPNFEVTLWNNRFSLSPIPTREGWPATITHFFQSLALDRGERAVAIILSGAGHDGTDGARAIKQENGLVLAQDLGTAGQSSMPFNVIDAGLADGVFPPNLMPAYLLNHFNIDLPEPLQFENLTTIIPDDDLQRLIWQLRRQTGYDFRDYKVSTLRRQIIRRMGLQQVETLPAYLILLEQKSGEAQQLVKGLLINVTSFFRDPEAFEELKTSALLPLLKTMSIDDVFRVWVPGCASGEEAVSIAIVIHECLRELNIQDMQVRVFATDLNRELIQRARSGIYPATISEQLSVSRLKDHFLKIEDGYQVRPHISRMIVWAEHNLIEHPPFSSLHLISCRNVLIYFQARLQTKIRAFFQFALRAGGILFLGSSEAMPEALDIFTIIDSKHKIYQRTPGAAYQWISLDQPLFTKAPSTSEDPMTAPAKSHGGSSDDHELRIIHAMLLDHYHSTCAIVDERYRVRYTYGDIDHYLRLIPGRDGQHSILSMAREGLDVELTIALYEAFESDRVVIRQGVSVKFAGGERLINVIVKPIHDAELSGRCQLIVFELSPAGRNLESAPPESREGEEGVTVTRLREELQQARQALQNATHALQAKSEELTSSLEEISSANEEIQTTNEELRTSKEELESMNEELNTLNTQLTNQNQALTQANNTLYNFLQSSANGVIFLDQRLAIREYTETVTRFFSLRKSDVGRPLSEIVSQFKHDTLTTDAANVLDTLVNIEREEQTVSGQWYKIEIRPYRTTNNIVDGLVLTFSDITDQKQARDQAELAYQYVRKVVDTIENSLLELDQEFRVIAANPAFFRQFQVQPEDTIGRLLFELGNGQWDIPDLRHLLSDILPQQSTVHDYVVQHDFPRIGQRTMRLNARQIEEIDRILLIITDVTDLISHHP
ncbi:MAG: PAS domain-containing protein [Chloroflexi bacterium]|nr:PAS domain-containing protein [Chloroflexota bacterium]